MTLRTTSLGFPFLSCAAGVTENGLRGHAKPRRRTDTGTDPSADGDGQTANPDAGGDSAEQGDFDAGSAACRVVVVSEPD